MKLSNVSFRKSSTWFSWMLKFGTPVVKSHNGNCKCYSTYFKDRNHVMCFNGMLIGKYELSKLNKRLFKKLLDDVLIKVYNMIFLNLVLTFKISKHLLCFL